MRIGYGYGRIVCAIRNIVGKERRILAIIWKRVAGSAHW